MRHRPYQRVEESTSRGEPEEEEEDDGEDDDDGMVVSTTTFESKSNLYKDSMIPSMKSIFNMVDIDDGLSKIGVSMAGVVDFGVVVVVVVPPFVVGIRLGKVMMYAENANIHSGTRVGLEGRLVNSMMRVQIPVSAWRKGVGRGEEDGGEEELDAVEADFTIDPFTFGHAS